MTEPKFSPGDIVYVKVTGEKVMVLREDNGVLANSIGYVCRIQNLGTYSFIEFELSPPPTPEEKEHLHI